MQTKSRSLPVCTRNFLTSQYVCHVRLELLWSRKCRGRWSPLRVNLFHSSALQSSRYQRLKSNNLQLCLSIHLFISIYPSLSTTLLLCCFSFNLGTARRRRAGSGWALCKACHKAARGSQGRWRERQGISTGWPDLGILPRSIKCVNLSFFSYSSQTALSQSFSCWLAGAPLLW